VAFTCSADDRACCGCAQHPSLKHLRQHVTFQRKVRIVLLFWSCDERTENLRCCITAAPSTLPSHKVVWFTSFHASACALPLCSFLLPFIPSFTYIIALPPHERYLTNSPSISHYASCVQLIGCVGTGTCNSGDFVEFDKTEFTSESGGKANAIVHLKVVIPPLPHIYKRIMVTFHGMICKLLNPGINYHLYRNPKNNGDCCN
jgi:hypothetical protein